MLCNKEFKEFSQSISGLDRFDDDIVDYCRYKFASIRSDMSRRNVTKTQHAPSKLHYF